MKSTKIVAICALAASLLVLPGCHDETFHNIYSNSQERAMGQEAADQINSTEKIDYNPADNTRVQTIANAVFVQAHKMRGNVTYQIKIIDSPEVNAFSLPGGYLYIYTGLLDKIGNDDDALAAVIGHESAHVVRRHAVKQMSDAGIKGGLVQLLGISTNNANEYNAASMVYELDQLHYSREDEYEADKYGLMFSYNAGYDPNGALRLFDKLAEVDKSGSEAAYAEDHPINRNRYLRVQELIKELRANDGRYKDMPANISGPTEPSAATPAKGSRK